jgi:hypothetical protein
LFSTISSDVPVILIPCIGAKKCASQLCEWPLIPNEARNIGTDLVEIKYLAYRDNDIIYEPGWLQALEAHAERTGIPVVAPLICIGPPERVIHHAGA